MRLPEAPVLPRPPIGPVTPVAPVMPWNPEAPTAPVAPCGPGAPLIPTTPAGPYETNKNTVLTVVLAAAKQPFSQQNISFKFVERDFNSRLRIINTNKV